MKLSVMTLGCPEWDLQTICSRAAEFGCDGVDFRGIQGELDVSKLPSFTTQVAQTRTLLADHGLLVSGISSSIHVCAPERRRSSIEEARRTLEAAVAVGAKHIRVFGEGSPDRIGYPDAAKIGLDCVREILRLPGADNVSWNFETHDHWTRSADCKLLLDAIPNPAFGVALDLAHTRRIGGESAAHTLGVLGERVRYVHIKDAILDPSHRYAMKDGWRYVLPGTGSVELDRGIAALKSYGYDGWLMFEHEKRWHPGLEAPEIAFPAFVRWAKKVLADQ
jgi:sugar phosphate isomerase/epimerase